MLGKLNDLKNKKFMTFDCYGTLIDWESGIVKTLQPILKKTGFDITTEEILKIYSELESNAEKGAFVNYKTILRKISKGFLSNFKIEPTKYNTDVLIDGFKQFEPFPDTVAALKMLGKKYDLGIISNVDKDIFKYSLKKIGVDIPFIVTSDSVGSYKPSLDVFKFALQSMNANIDEVVHVAQSIYHDIAPAKKLGIATILVTRSKAHGGFGAVPKVELEGEPDLVVKDLLTLISLHEPK
jgi:2-haloacid dehalogenase